MADTVDPRLAEVDEAVDTLGGLAIALAGRVPKAGECLTHPTAAGGSRSSAPTRAGSRGCGCIPRWNSSQRKSKKAAMHRYLRHALIILVPEVRIVFLVWMWTASPTAFA